MRYQPDQVPAKKPAPFLLVRQTVRRAAVMAMFFSASFMAAIPNARATGSLPNSDAATFFSTGAPYNLACPFVCPFAGIGQFTVPGVCCSEPDVVLMQEFRGPAANGRQSLDGWYTSSFWRLINTKIKSVTQQIVHTVQRETTKRGSFLEGQDHIRAISSLQQESARSARSHLPSEQLCRFATLSQSLASSDANSAAVKIVLSKSAIDRELLTAGSGPAESVTGTATTRAVTRGQSADKKTRWAEYKTMFCDPSDFSQGSGANGVCQGTDSTQYNKDVNYTRALAEPLTLDIDGVTATKDQASLTALSENLYAHDLVNNIPPAVFDATSDSNQAQARKYTKFLSVLAKRSVAQDSFDSIAALKAKGSAGNAKYMINLMKELGVSETDAKKFVTDNPSYYAQMEMLTRKLYQSPSFYVNLMEGPVNVKRQQAVMKSFELMQQRDMYKSLQRSEMLMATLLELELRNGEGGANKNLGQSQ